MNRLLIATLLLCSSAALAQTNEPSDPNATTAPTTASSDAADATVPPGSILLAPKVGFFKSTSALGGAPYLGAELGYVLPVLERKLALSLEFSWTPPQFSSSISDPRLTVDGNTVDGSYTLSMSELSLLLSAVYRLENVVEHFTPYAGVGPSLYFHSAKMEAFGSTNTERATRFGFQVLLGGEYAVGPGGVFLEAHYHFEPIDFVTTGNTNVGGFLAAVGYRFRF